MYAPSGLHDTVLLNTFARKLICFGSPPADGTTKTFANDLPVTEVYAIHRLSGDQTSGRTARRGGRSKMPFAKSRSCFASRSRIRSSRAFRSNAINLPSVEKAGDASAAASLVS